MKPDPCKKMLRTHYQNLRKTLSPAEQKTASAQVCQRILALDDYQKAMHVAIYHAVNGEIDLSALQDYVDNSLRRPATCSQDPKILIHTKNRNGSRGQAAGRRHMNDLQDKIFYYPVLNDKQSLLFLPVTPETVFHKNRFGIPEPQVNHEHAIRPWLLDIIFLPLLAFDEHGTRLGMGGGYYDKTLASHRPSLLIGAAHDFQRQTYIRPETWDVPLTAIITERTIYWSKP